MAEPTDTQETHFFDKLIAAYKAIDIENCDIAVLTGLKATLSVMLIEVTSELDSTILALLTDDPTCPECGATLEIAIEPADGPDLIKH